MTPENFIAIPSGLTDHDRADWCLLVVQELKAMRAEIRMSVPDRGCVEDTIKILEKTAKELLNDAE